MNTLSIMYPTVLDVGCFSHTLDLVGSHFKTPSLEMFHEAPAEYIVCSSTAASQRYFGMRRQDKLLCTIPQQGGGAGGSV